MAAEVLPDILRKYSAEIGPVLPLDLNGPAVCRLDFSAENPFWQDASLEDTADFEAMVQALLRAKNAAIGVGGYLEDRVIYRRSEHFTTASEKRTIHLGVDVWLPAFTPVLAPLNGRVHSFRDNSNFGDYGPCIILEHELENQIFYTLYGHLTRLSLLNLAVGQRVNKGNIFSQVGPFPENGDWPPHLHFQVMTDMLSLAGDFPGVCAPSQLAQFRQICPNPNLMLQCKYLD
ncbi:peptidoglycan DD-metalloendopeptidase family protein [Adhaeribacter rhizoryzae]|uniref:Peptidoglycan DD-metalloendopeptidase family protein n=1 Tax=Adhaeribacter rhizoryzae TaxID=2607907 RepID=A0A5M6D4M5_9BACT|nr:peptidoglycan DD-metalloendopeptidase family protein [Adhaeribacter rhizoryzae]KAA5542441.1 peptidoglycan DD-metalloendopeptidase family protein [Adhaeribacter rhizoryzae]